MQTSKNILTPYIKSLFLEPPNLTPSDLSTVLRCIFRGIPSDVQVAAFLTALKMRGLDHDPDYIAAALNTILEFSSMIPLELIDKSGFIDIVGTGGDGQDTFNVSTSAAIVAAGMGLPICKHGSNASTSKSGSADMIKSLGINLINVSDKNTPKIVEKCNFCFLYAPSFHQGMSKVASVRNQLGIPTIFNILGPLINPMPLKARILGVYSEKLGEAYANAVSILTSQNKINQRTMIVFGDIGLDEISPTGFTKCWIIENDGSIIKLIISPKDFGLPEHDLNLVKSGTPEQNSEILLHILRQDSFGFKIRDINDSNNHPIVDFILLNSAALAVVSGIADSWVHGVQLAKKSIISGSALQALEQFKQVVNSIKD